jgi:hypothetical protein
MTKPSPNAARSARVALHHRDLEILEFILRRRIETLDTLTERYFNTTKTARNRLRALERAGYLERTGFETPDRARTSAYHLGSRAPAALRLRSLAGDLLGPGSHKELARGAIPHQLQVNRAADLLGTDLIPEALLGCQDTDRQHRPDGGYQAAAADPHGRALVLLEVDLGHYSRQRILGKVATFTTHPDAIGVLFVTTTPQRADLIAHWITHTHGEQIMKRIQVLTFNELRGHQDSLNKSLAPEHEPSSLLYG